MAPQICIKYAQQTEDQKMKDKLLVLFEHETFLQEGQTRGESKADLLHDTT